MTMKVLFLLVFAALSTEAFGCDRVLKVGVSQSWRPYVFSQNDQLTGIDIEITDLVLKEAGFCSQFIAMPSSKRGFAELKHGTVDLLPAASYSQQRDDFSTFSVPYRNEVMRLFWYPHSHLESQDLKGLLDHKQTILTNSGSYYGDELTRLSANKKYKDQFVTVPSLRQRLAMLVAKRVDFFIDDELAGLSLIQQHQANNVKIHPYIINNDYIYFMLSDLSLSEEERQAINHAIQFNKQAITDIISSYKTQ
ncbi:transporter substrate-binding domain-containing protein [Pseudoalteromonas sp. MT33b]|jgi:polar amino acid transport system substrate-binding protein|uniref:substrate-binding periplasmic protein n=1 Tax=Pseudoalteromonas sp. MT33b TaxID=2759705 RepID=UPI0015FD9E93|nr:transporter substrate-binding domain-containing protein [Pseudoalteromonas sp. MT33b]QMW16749.1 transporter substrate-binding domain-containing protein [Pseudoalteromonas sp. MT33b]